MLLVQNLHPDGNGNLIEGAKRQRHVKSSKVKAVVEWDPWECTNERQGSA